MPAFFTWYTDGYKRYADELAESLARFEIPLISIQEDNTKNWLQNLQIKTNVIYTIAATHDLGEKFVWIDSDCLVVDNPVEFLDIKEDIAVHKYTDQKSFTNGRLYSAAIIYFKISFQVRNVFQRWVELHREARKDDGERSLKEAIIEAGDKISILALPEEYYTTIEKTKAMLNPVIKIKDSRHLHQYLQED